MKYMVDDVGMLSLKIPGPCYKISSKSSSRLRDYVCTRHLEMTVFISTLVSSDIGD